MELFLKLREHRVEIRRAVVPGSVDKKARRTVYATANATPAIVFNPFGNYGLPDGGSEFFQVQSYLLGPSGENVRRQRILMLVDDVVHLPKLPLESGRFRCLGGNHRIRVGLSQWEISEDETKFFAERLLQTFDDWIGSAAVRALIVSVF